MRSVIDVFVRLRRTFLVAVVAAGLFAALWPQGAGTAAQPDAPAAAKPAIGTWTYSSDGGQTWSAVRPSTKANSFTSCKARLTFTAEAMKDAKFFIVECNLTGAGKEIALNGAKLPNLLAGMTYDTFPAADVKVLKAGENVLECKLPAMAVLPGEEAPLPDLAPKADKDLKIILGPVLGPATPDSLLATCRTNIPATVKMSVRAGKGTATTGEASKEGLFHELHVADIKGKQLEYRLEATAGATTVATDWTAFHLPPATGKTRFIALGDNRTDAATWRKVAAAADAEEADFLVHTGDVVAVGGEDASWKASFIDPAAKFLGSTPMFSVIGNHENNSPMFDLMLPAPPSRHGRSWVQDVGEVTFIGLDGAVDFSDGTPAGKWLATALDKAKGKFLFVITHYPAWTSSKHGAADAAGTPAEKVVRQSQSVIMPMMTKYGATAMLCGHSHGYERAEVNGVTEIVTGGAGAKLHPKSDNAEQNPYSKVFNATYHYCIFTVDGDTCEMKAIGLDGKTIDSTSWKARMPVKAESGK